MPTAATSMPFNWEVNRLKMGEEGMSPCNATGPHCNVREVGCQPSFQVDAEILHTRRNRPYSTIACTRPTCRHNRGPCNRTLSSIDDDYHTDHVCSFYKKGTDNDDGAVYLFGASRLCFFTGSCEKAGHVLGKASEWVVRSCSIFFGVTVCACKDRVSVFSASTASMPTR